MSGHFISHLPVVVSEENLTNQPALLQATGLQATRRRSVVLLFSATEIIKPVRWTFSSGVSAAVLSPAEALHAATSWNARWVGGGTSWLKLTQLLTWMDLKWGCFFLAGLPTGSSNPPLAVDANISQVGVMGALFNFFGKKYQSISCNTWSHRELTIMPVKLWISPTRRVEIRCLTMPQPPPVSRMVRTSKAHWKLASNSG